MVIVGVKNPKRGSLILGRGGVEWRLECYSTSSKKGEREQAQEIVAEEDHLIL